MTPDPQLVVDAGEWVQDPTRTTHELLDRVMSEARFLANAPRDTAAQPRREAVAQITVALSRIAARIEQLEAALTWWRENYELGDTTVQALARDARIKELEARNELLERDRPLHCRGCDGHDIDLLGDPE